MTADIGLQIFVFSVMHSTDVCNRLLCAGDIEVTRRARCLASGANEFSPLEDDNWGELCIVV